LLISLKQEGVVAEAEAAAVPWTDAGGYRFLLSRLLCPGGSGQVAMRSKEDCGSWAALQSAVA